MRHRVFFHEKHEKKRACHGIFFHEKHEKNEVYTIKKQALHEDPPRICRICSANAPYPQVAQQALHEDPAQD